MDAFADGMAALEAGFQSFVNIILVSLAKLLLGNNWQYFNFSGGLISDILDLLTANSNIWFLAFFAVIYFGIMRWMRAKDRQLERGKYF